jgi:hypothetical protein
MITFRLHEMVISGVRIEVVWRWCGALNFNAFRFAKPCQGGPVGALILLDILLGIVAGFPLACPGCNCLKSWHQKLVRPYHADWGTFQDCLGTVQFGFFWFADRGGNSNPANLGLMVAVAGGKHTGEPVPQHQFHSLVGKVRRANFNSSISNDAFSSVLFLTCE